MAPSATGSSQRSSPSDKTLPGPFAPRTLYPRTPLKEQQAHMSTASADIEQTVATFLTRVKKLRDDFTPDMPLYADGVGLDSLETAELSALLEDNHGSDPFSSGTMPQTLREILGFYGVVAAEA